MKINVKTIAASGFVLVLLAVLASYSNENGSNKPEMTTNDTNEQPVKEFTDAKKQTSALGETTLVFDSNRNNDTQQLFLFDTSDSEIKQLTFDEKYHHFFPKISPDRTKILYHKSPAGKNVEDFSKTAIWVIKIDGSKNRQIRGAPDDVGWNFQGHAEWSPDGKEIVLIGGSETSNLNIYIIDADTGEIKRMLTNFQTGVALDPSWSPDGKTIIFTGCNYKKCYPGDLDIYTVPSNGGEYKLIYEDDMRNHDPYFSGDGKRIAWLVETKKPSLFKPGGTWGIKIADIDVNQNLSNVRTLIDDGNINSKPEWNGSGEKIYFHRLVYGVDKSFNIWSINTDGSGLIRIEPSATKRNEFPDIL